MRKIENNTSIVVWLLTGAFLILAMVVIGGITRLTGSGLSMVEWKVISGTLPPLSEAEWQEAFHKYQQFPEYQKVNFSMDLSGFKQIFWWEYLHRLLGRVLGIVFLVPFFLFLWRKQLSGWLIKRLLVILLLGAAQGLMGWLMVKSGLVDNPHVSHFRLAAHLGLAFTLMGTILWTVADLVSPGKSCTVTPTSVHTWGLVVLGVVSVQIVLGAFVAGLKAGFSYNTFPLMNEELFPRSQWDSLTLQTFLENGPLMQFAHRWVAWGVLGALVWFWHKSKQQQTARTWANLLLLTGLLQLALGIATLLLQVPVWLGVLHQVVAAVLFSCAVLAVHQTRARKGMTK